MSIAFGAFGISFLISNVAFVEKKETLAMVTGYIECVLFYASCFILTLILNSLTKRMSKQMQEALDTTDESIGSIPDVSLDYDIFQQSNSISVVKFGSSEV